MTYPEIHPNSPAASAQHRADTLARLRENPAVPVLIIGGGINGVGLFRELALQGVDVLLAERGDYAGGASAASTRVIHGGIRYLENGEFRLVRESIAERNRLLRLAPHAVRPLPTTIPLFSWSAGLIHAARNFFGLKSRPSDRGAATIKIGLTMYDVFSDGGKSLPRHTFASRAAALAKRPALNPAIVATATYYDAQISTPERLCVELVLDAERDHAGARALNYTAAVAVEAGAVVLEDRLSGERVRVQPQCVVNAAGAWIDFANAGMGRPTRFIGGTKGSHLVIDHPALWAMMRGEMIFFSNPDDGRTCIFYPVEDRVIAGATDIPIDDPDDAVCTDDEIAYILEAMRLVFPSIHVERAHIALTFSGVRPLPRSDALTPGQISRDHSTPVMPAESGFPFPVFNLVGGKWTTYRAFGEQVADRLLPLLGRQRTRSSHALPIGGGAGYPADSTAWAAALADAHGLSHAHAEALFRRYGTRAQAVAAYLAAGPDRPLAHLPPPSEHANPLAHMTTREIAYLAVYEDAPHLSDILLRRTLIGILGYTTPPLLDAIADAMGDALGWDSDRRRAEVHETTRVLREKFRMRATDPESVTR
jgi:glycerol-3-phosphate dehydrogenase